MIKYRRKELIKIMANEHHEAPKPASSDQKPSGEKGSLGKTLSVEGIAGGLTDDLIVVPIAEGVMLEGLAVKPVEDLMTGGIFENQGGSGKYTKKAA